MLRFLHQVQHMLKLVARLDRLALQALRQQHGEATGVHLQHAADHGGVHPLGP